MKTPVKTFAAALLLSGASSALADVHYVDVNGTNATPPYSNWATAATNIQDAVDAAVTGDELVVTNGVYSYVIVNIPVNVRSVNGPQSTTIDGSNSGRCAYLTNGACLSGFTLTRGHAFDLGGGVSGDNGGYGGYGGTLNNCKLAFNFSGFGGGAAYLCTLNNCTLSGNQAYSSPGDDAFGGGALNCALNNCTMIGNSAGAVIDGYSFYGYGGGAYSCTLNNCILTSNSAHNSGGGAAYCTLNNCIVWLNTASQWADVYGSSGFGYGTADPRFVHQGNNALHLRPNSPCINAGDNSYVTTATDLDGNPRISGGTVDIGAYEYQWPQLTLTPSDTNVLLTWPTNNAGYDYAGFTLQSTTNLGSPVWTTNSAASVVIAGQNTVTNPISGAQQFYRLVQ